jgi:putative transposase
VSRFIDEHRDRFGVEPVCRVLGVSASAYYQRRTGRRSRRAVEDERLVERIREVHAANYYAYGARRMWKALRRAGESVGRGRVERLMRAHGIQGAKRRGKPWRTTTPDAAAAGSRAERLHCHRAEPALGRRHHLPALLGGRDVVALEHDGALDELIDVGVERIVAFLGVGLERWCAD